MNRLTLIATRLALLAVVLIAWDALPRLGVVDARMLPPFGDVLAMLADLVGRPKVQEAIGVSAGEFAVAFAVAIPLGAAIGIAIAENDYLGEIFKPMLFYVFSVPKSIFLPMFILAFGIGFQQKVAYAAFSTIFIVIMTATAAIESVKPDHLLVARSYGATRAQVIGRVYLPSMMPVLLESLRLSMIFNFTGVLIAEMYASRTGIGQMISSWGENFQMVQLFAGVVLLATAAIVLNEAIRWLEARCSAWRT